MDSCKLLLVFDTNALINPVGFKMLQKIMENAESTLPASVTLVIPRVACLELHSLMRDSHSFPDTKKKRELKDRIMKAFFYLIYNILKLFNDLLTNIKGSWNGLNIDASFIQSLNDVMNDITASLSKMIPDYDIMESINDGINSVIDFFNGVITDNSLKEILKQRSRLHFQTKFFAEYLQTIFYPADGKYRSAYDSEILIYVLFLRHTKCSDIWLITGDRELQARAARSGLIAMEAKTLQKALKLRPYDRLDPKGADYHMWRSPRAPFVKMTFPCGDPISFMTSSTLDRIQAFAHLEQERTDALRTGIMHGTSYPTSVAAEKPDYIKNEQRAPSVVYKAVAVPEKRHIYETQPVQFARRQLNVNETKSLVVPEKPCCSRKA
ncbi:uncharacterized protein LOC129593079 [Paramacrobiotus metropolitanus]|uniref:uncharacterized protein LOC129593079 n=1 Tax=Paramacrobiotus metropolitanus TaxID=2943436 RepID=UPI00244583DD|nr:uncharacterized protein LOC129593079 [Paramacrobiotus metropolitanus]